MNMHITWVIVASVAVGAVGIIFIFDRILWHLILRANRR